jgi:hypothetical protein
MALRDCECIWTTDFDDMMNALLIRGKILGGLAPVGIVLVVDDMVCTEFLGVSLLCCPTRWWQ